MKKLIVSVFTMLVLSVPCLAGDLEIPGRQGDLEIPGVTLTACLDVLHFIVKV